MGTAKKNNDIFKLLLNEELTYETIPEIKKNFLKNFKKENKIIMDFINVKKMDSAGLAFIIYIHNKFEADIEIMNIAENIRHIFKLDKSTSGMIK